MKFSCIMKKERSLFQYLQARAPKGLGYRTSGETWADNYNPGSRRKDFGSTQCRISIPKIGTWLQKGRMGSKILCQQPQPFSEVILSSEKTFYCQPGIWCFKDFSQIGSLPGPEYKDFLDIHSFAWIMYHDYGPKIGKTTYLLNCYINNLYARKKWGRGKEEQWETHRWEILTSSNSELIYTKGREPPQKDAQIMQDSMVLWQKQWLGATAPLPITQWLWDLVQLLDFFKPRYL